MTAADVETAALRDRLNAVPTLMLVQAIDLRFPHADSAAWRWINIDGVGLLNRLRGHEERSRRYRGSTRPGGLGPRRLERRCQDADDHVLHRCDATRLRKVWEGLLAAYLRGSGEYAEEFLERLLEVGPR